jgi:hypothetical protein
MTFEQSFFAVVAVILLGAIAAIPVVAIYDIWKSPHPSSGSIIIVGMLLVGAVLGGIAGIVWALTNFF